MTQATQTPPLRAAALPANVRLGEGTVITGDYVGNDHAFRRCRSRLDPAVVIGRRGVMHGVFFNVGEGGRITIGDDCQFQEAFLICEQELTIGNRVVIGWHATIVDSDFHPVETNLRHQDAIALSPQGAGRPRPPFVSKPVAIEDDVWIGPNATVLKGVRIGKGSLIEPGAVVTRDVPPASRVLGNPAQIIGPAQ